MICLLGMIFNLIFVSGLPWQYFAIRAESLCKGTPAENLYETLQALEIEFNAEMQTRGKDLWANVEYYKGAVFVALGIPADNFTALFAMARSVGWLAHFIEDRQDNRIFRPKAEYTGQQYRDLSA